MRKLVFITTIFVLVLVIAGVVTAQIKNPKRGYEKLMPKDKDDQTVLQNRIFELNARIKVLKKRKKQLDRYINDPNIQEEEAFEWGVVVDAIVRAVESMRNEIEEIRKEISWRLTIPIETQEEINATEKKIIELWSKGQEKKARETENELRQMLKKYHRLYDEKKQEKRRINPPNPNFIRMFPENIQDKIGHINKQIDELLSEENPANEKKILELQIELQEIYDHWYEKLIKEGKIEKPRREFLTNEEIMQKLPAELKRNLKDLDKMVKEAFEKGEFKKGQQLSEQYDKIWKEAKEKYGRIYEVRIDQITKRLFKLINKQERENIDNINNKLLNAMKERNEKQVKKLREQLEWYKRILVNKYPFVNLDDNSERLPKELIWDNIDEKTKKQIEEVRHQAEKLREEGKKDLAEEMFAKAEKMFEKAKNIFIEKYRKENKERRLAEAQWWKILPKISQEKLKELNNKLEIAVLGGKLDLAEKINKEIREFRDEAHKIQRDKFEAEKEKMGTPKQRLIKQIEQLEKILIESKQKLEELEIQLKKATEEKNKDRIKELEMLKKLNATKCKDLEENLERMRLELKNENFSEAKNKTQKKWWMFLPEKEQKIAQELIQKLDEARMNDDFELSAKISKELKEYKDKVKVEVEKAEKEYKQLQVAETKEKIKRLSGEKSAISKILENMKEELAKAEKEDNQDEVAKIKEMMKEKEIMLNHLIEQLQELELKLKKLVD